MQDLRRARAKLETVEILERDGRRFARVELSYGEGRTASEFPVGEAGDEIAAVAEATLSAARTLAQSRFSCALAFAQQMDALGQHMLLVNATVYVRGRTIPVYGASVIRENPLESTARASLDAVNRFLDLSLPDPALGGFDDFDRLHTGEDD
jgi:hypothetical protein